MIVTDDTMAANMYRVGGKISVNFGFFKPARMHDPNNTHTHTQATHF